jgi:hypothetical protein
LLRFGPLSATSRRLARSVPRVTFKTHKWESEGGRCEALEGCALKSILLIGFIRFYPTFSPEFADSPT